MSDTLAEMIGAAGGLLWRRSSAGYEVAIVHRKRYDDWTLPKGKLNDGEAWEQAALREVKEETGYDATVLAFAGAIAYQSDHQPKVVRFWHMMATGEPAPRIDDEVAEVLWLPPTVARRRLQYPLEQALIDVSLAPKKGNATSKDDFPNVTAPAPKTSSRSSFLVSWFRSVQKQWRNFIRPISLQRLETTIETFEPELDALIEERQQTTGYKFERRWDQRAKQLLETAKAALNQYNPERGWRCLKASDRFCFYGLSDEEVQNEAKAILAEASDEDKELTKWRKRSILELLTDSPGKLKDPLKKGDVIRAKRVLDEHQDNTYQKLAILRTRLRLLTTISVVALIVWLMVPPLAPSLISLTASPSGTTAEALTSPLPNRLLWFAVILSGLIGAIVSGFTSSFSRDQKKTRIPAELSTSTITFARLVLAMVSALAVSIFLVSGVLNFPKPSYELLLAVALVSGFSDRLLLRAIESLSKPS
jgi:ADP-ribose pyrophosphatase YjhB (NUDIX family)